MSVNAINTSTKLTKEERNLSLRLSGLFSIRMLGIFIILPILAEYSKSLGASPFATGLIFASYAITQIIMQPLFGIISDRVGRKPALIVGLALFTFGSIILMFTSSVYIAILGRVIQGAGAVSAVILALATDLTREYIRAKVMAFIGISIGIAFGVAFGIAPTVYFFLKGFGIFGICALLGIIGIFITIKFIPRVPVDTDRATDNKETFKELSEIAFNDKDVVRLYFGAFMLHLLLTMTFASLPKLVDIYNISSFAMSFYYIMSFIISILVMFIFVALAERFYRHRLLFLFAIIILAFSYIAMLIFGLSEGNKLVLFWSLVLFFIGFNMLEATQPSLMSRFADKDYRGTIMGVFSSCQFLGTAVGGMVGSIIAGYLGGTYVFYVTFFLSFTWLVIAWPMNNPIRMPVKSE